MKKHYKAVFPFIAFLCLFAPFSARATHVMGADIEWKCLGNDSFELIVHAYRDCNGIQLTGTNLTYQTTGDTCVSTPVNANPDVCCGIDVTPVCPGYPDECKDPGNSTFPYGIEEFTITAIVYLPPPCCNYTIAWYESARNSAITTGAANQDFYDEVYLNRCVKPCVSSPYFTIPPIAMYCVNQCIVYNPGVDDDSRDAEGRADSLSYSFGRPQSAQGNFISYTSPYSYDAPLIYAGKSKDQPFVPPYCYGFHLDSTTGDIMFKATKTDITVMVVVVSIYRRDSLGIERKIGQISRDLQIMILNCPTNRPPIIPGINGGNTYSEKICADKQTCFKVLAFDLDPPDSVKLGWNNPGTMDGATFTVLPDGKKWPTAEFCWYPTDKDVRSYPYTFIAMAVDNACDPLPGRSSRAFSIYVIAAPSATYNADVSKCGMVCFQASPAPNSATSVTSYTWVGEGAPGYAPLYILGRTGCYQYTRGGTYHYTLIVSGPNGCTRSYSDSVVIPKFAGISLGPDTTVCNDKPTLTFKATPVNALQPYQIWWSTLKDANGDSLTTGSITEKITKDTAFRVNIFAQGCHNYDSVKVHVKQLPLPNVGPDQRGCWGHPVLLTTGLKHEPKVTWTWILPKDTQRNAFRGDSIRVVDSGLYVVTVQDSIGCPGTSSANVYFNPPVKANQVDSTICEGSTVTLRAGTGGPGASYQWMDRIHGNRIVANTPIYTFTANAQSGYGVQADLEMVIKNTGYGLTCVDTGYYNIRVNTPTHPKLTPPKNMCVTDPAVALATGPPLVDILHQGGNWIYPRKPSAIVNNFIYPSIMGETDKDPSLGYIHYIYVNGFKCVTNDSVRVNIVNKPVVSAGPDTEICTASGRYRLNLLGGFPAGGQWFMVTGPKNALQYSKNLDSVFFNPNVAGITNDVYHVSYNYHDPKGPCSNMATVLIKVKTNPTVTVPKIDSLCNNALEYPLEANPPAGIWAIDDGYTPQSALVFHKADNTYGFLAGDAGTVNPWHYLKYTAYGDRQLNMCPTTLRDSVFVVPAPLNPDFHTADNSWEYCDDNAAVSLVRTINGKKTILGEFATIGDVTNTGNDWIFSPGFADTVNTNSVTYILPYNKGQCFVKATHNIKVDGHAFVNILSAPNLCSGPNSFEIKAVKSNSNRITWSGLGSFKLASGTDSTDVYYFPTPDQLNLSYSFQVMVKDSNNGVCPAHVSVGNFIINQPPVPKFSSNRDGCEPLVVRFNSDSSSVGGVSNGSVIKGYDWDFGDSSAHSQDPNPLHVYKVTNGKDTQQFSVTLTETSDSGCVASQEKKNWITVYATPKPVIAANPQFTTIALPQVQFTFDPRSSGIDFNDQATTYRWNFGDNSPDNISTLRNPGHSYGDTGAFKVRVAVTSKGCTGDTLITVYVQPELIIYIPNVFKPDNHHPERKTSSDVLNYYSAEVNNTFQPVISAYQSFEMSIYNRWGQLMYTTADPNKGWTGWFEGHEPVQDAYVYVIKAIGYSGKPYTFTGTVTLVY